MSVNTIEKYAAAEIASRFINHTNRSIFLTGKAGTGKTTFLKYITKSTHKKVVIAAPTGIAAINAGGVTLHSLFQIPFGAFVPEKQPSTLVLNNNRVNDPYSIIQHISLRGNKRKLLQEIELLIIDEVSMLRADVLDAIDTLLRYVRRDQRTPFGGLQILFIGDLLQLPPVIKDDEWQVLQRYYKSQWFFDAYALKNEKPVYVELDKIYRQQDQSFISLLNNLRNNTVSEMDVETLNRYYKPGFKAPEDENYIYLTTHNYKADNVNRSQLQKLKSPAHIFHAEVEGDFPDYMFPVDPEMELKEGAQVMFIKNDLNEEKRFFNGKIGKVAEINHDSVTIEFDDGSQAVELEHYTWENKKYSLNEITNEVEERIVGTFKQFPVRLAWAITVHKSQGLTFSKAIIDVGSAFAPGQVYVALSRLTSLDGLVLTSSINYESISKDEAVSTYSGSKDEQGPLEESLEKHSLEYLEQFSLSSFNFFQLKQELKWHLDSYSKDEGKSNKQKHVDWARKLMNDFGPVFETSEKFLRQLKGIFDQKPVDFKLLHSRIVSAKNYFLPLLKEVNTKIIEQVRVAQSESRTKTYQNELRDLDAHFYARQQKISKAEALVNSAINHTELTLKELGIEEENNERMKNAGTVMTSSKRKGKTKTASGEPKQPKIPTREISYSLYKEGKNLEEIAAERSLTVNTIMSHLSQYVADGTLRASQFVKPEKLEKIFKALEEIEAEHLGPVKEYLGEDFSYGEIRFALAEMKREKEKAG